MSLSHYNPHTRYRDRAIQQFTTTLVVILVMVTVCAIGFWLGRQYAGREVVGMREQAELLAQEREALQENVTQLRAEAQVANTRHEQLQQQYEAMVPEGPMRDLTPLLLQQIEQGMDPQRLAFVIRSARPPQGCTEPETKRFVVSTPAYKGPESAVMIADGAVLISGSGDSARNDKGQPEAWFDPAKEVTIRFKTAAGEDVKKSTLPLRYSTVTGDREYRFSIEEGSRSFAKVTFDSCAYP